MRQARYGLRVERVGEASNPGPDLEVEGVAPTQEDSGTHGSGVVHFNLTQKDAPTEETCSDTESCRSQDVTSVRPSGRRLRLVWDEERVPPQRWHPEARVVEGLFRTLGGRIGAVPFGSPIPRVLRRQRWSPVNVPLVWAAAGEGRSTPVLDDQSCRDPVEFYEGHIPVRRSNVGVDVVARCSQVLGN